MGHNSMFAALSHLVSSWAHRYSSLFRLLVPLLLMSTLQQAASLSDLLATLTPNVDTMSLIAQSCKPRPTQRCATCHEAHANHAWGRLGPHCLGHQAKHESDDEEDRNQNDDNDSLVRSVSGMIVQNLIPA